MGIHPWEGVTVRLRVHCFAARGDLEYSTSPAIGLHFHLQDGICVSVETAEVLSQKSKAKFTARPQLRAQKCQLLTCRIAKLYSARHWRTVCLEQWKTFWTRGCFVGEEQGAAGMLLRSTRAAVARTLGPENRKIEFSVWNYSCLCSFNGS